jgi:hypothetical protein
VIAGILLFGSLFQIRSNKASSASAKRTHVNNNKHTPNAARYYSGHPEDDDDFQWKNVLYSNRSHYSYEKHRKDGAKEVDRTEGRGTADVPGKLTATWTGPGLRWPYSNSALINCSTLQEVTDLEFVASGWTKAVYKGR